DYYCQSFDSNGYVLF
nr:immunoglobulin light chain junction region [Macaca mulatta]MOY14657.1 immunoglobulin light chain junction region [Macaca mulatta]MOY14704.1 immunoglobulin light chain junction region [Macaca mulatta]MOY14723.1 immunoglobulin light chain junction region [Macaca mulatta]MOY14741.1 immunoglobulin light chain junction region [Macaca mulatta]